MSKISKVKVENKTYKISKISSKETLRIGFKLNKMFASPILSFGVDLLFSNIDDKASKLDDAKKLLENKDGLKKEVVTLFSNFSENFDENYEMLDSLLGEIQVEETVSGEDSEEIKEYKISFEKDFEFDNLDLWIDLVIASLKLNFETGLRQVLGKYGFLSKTS